MVTYSYDTPESWYPSQQQPQGTQTSLGLDTNSTLGGFDPRGANGQPQKRSWWQQAGGALTGLDAFSDLNAMRNPAQNTFKAGIVDPGTGAYQIGNNYGGTLDQALADVRGRQAPTMQSAQAQGATLSPFARATFAPGQAAQGSDFARVQAELAGGPGAFGGARINQNPSNQWRGQQQDLVSALQARAAGRAPSAAEQQLQQGLGQEINAQKSQVASARGVSAGLAQRMASQNIAQAQGQTNVEAAKLRAGEQAQAEQTLGSVLSGGREQDIGLATGQAGLRQQAGLQTQALGMQGNLQNAQLGTQANLAQAGFQQQRDMANLANAQQMGMLNTQMGGQFGLANAQAENQYGLAGAQLAQQAGQFNASLEQQANMQNLQANLTNNAQVDQATQAYLSMGMSREQAQQQAIADYYKLMAQQQQAANTVNADVAKQNVDSQNKANAGIIGAAGSALGSIFSDERLKDDIDERAGEKAAGDLLDALHAARFTYKDQAHGRGPQLGIMAQSAERSEAGRSFVVDTPRGKMIDATRAVGPLLAALKFTHERVKRLERRVG